MRSVTISEVHMLCHYVYMCVWMQNFVNVLHALHDVPYNEPPCTCTMSFTSANVAILYAGALRWHVVHRRMLCHMPS